MDMIFDEKKNQARTKIWSISEGHEVRVTVFLLWRDEEELYAYPLAFTVASSIQDQASTL